MIGKSDIATFKANPAAQEIFLRMHLSDFLRKARDWNELQQFVVHYNDKTKGGGWVERARRLDGVASSGERVLLHAILYATDFAVLADELSGDHSWRRLGNVSGSHLRAVVACIRRDAP